MGDPGTGVIMQLATSYLPADLARGTALENSETGPGGIYARMEDMGYAPLRWHEAISARMPTPAESKLLGLSQGVPVLRILRSTSSGGNEPLEVNDTRLDAERFEVGYPISRDSSAR